MPFIEAAAQGLATQAAEAGMGLIFGGINDNRQYKANKRNQALQIKGMKEMADYNYGKQLQMWQDTGYGPTVAQMKAAGINPAIMYGGGGAGGGTTGSGPGGGPSGGAAPSSGGEATAMGGMGIQLALMDAQRKNIEANTAKTIAETTKTAGVDTQEAETRIASLTQGITNAKAQEAMTRAQTRLTNIESSFQEKTFRDREDYITYQASKALEEVEIAKAEAWMAPQAATEKMDIIRAEAIGALLKNELTITQTKTGEKSVELTDAQIKKIGADISNATKGLDQEQQKIEIQRALKNYTITGGIVDKIMKLIRR